VPGHICTLKYPYMTIQETCRTASDRPNHKTYIKKYKKYLDNKERRVISGGHASVICLTTQVVRPAQCATACTFEYVCHLISGNITIYIKFIITQHLRPMLDWVHQRHYHIIKNIHNIKRIIYDYPVNVSPIYIIIIIIYNKKECRVKYG